MRVLISGAGIAGPALAFWLHRAGADVTIVEKAPGMRPGGHAVDIRGVAKGVVDRMGLTAAIRAEQVDERGIALVDKRGRRLAEMPADLFGGEGIVAEIEIARGDLSRVLIEATATMADYRFGDRITALTPDGRVTFQSGGTSQYDVVVGADGVHSGVRALSFGPQDRFVRPLGCYGALFTVPDMGDLDHWAHMYNAPGGRVVLVRPTRDGRAMAGLNFVTSKRYGRLSRPEQLGLIARNLAGAGWKVPSLLAAMPDAEDFYFDSVDQVHVDRWSRGRTVLLGDAGYCGSPLAGLGTSMSIVGAYVLAGELATRPDPAAAFEAYQSGMASYVKEGMQLPPGGIHAYAPKSRLMIRARAASMRSMSRWPMKQMLAKQFGKADAITLKDYDLAAR
ncbi:FAD-dependent monooxygenase [Actinoplanes sp. NPDC049596]|uniref:FAD-dependent monooxygenase n=1 Tax=unclassified Actinoplanes TaxID=2626549 RepID=UPI00343B9892